MRLWFFCMRTGPTSNIRCHGRLLCFSISQSLFMRSVGRFVLLYVARYELFFRNGNDGIC